MCNHPGRQLDLRCVDCHKRVQAKMRQKLLDDLQEQGISLEDAYWLIEQVEQMSQEMRDKINS